MRCCAFGLYSHQWRLTRPFIPNLLRLFYPVASLEHRESDIGSWHGGPLFRCPPRSARQRVFVYLLAWTREIGGHLEAVSPAGLWKNSRASRRSPVCVRTKPRTVSPHPVHLPQTTVPHTHMTTFELLDARSGSSGQTCRVQYSLIKSLELLNDVTYSKSRSRTTSRS